MSECHTLLEFEFAMAQAPEGFTPVRRVRLPSGQFKLYVGECIRRTVDAYFRYPSVEPMLIEYVPGRAPCIFCNSTHGATDPFNLLVSP